MGKKQNGSSPVRESIAIALMCAAVSATAASVLHQPFFIFAGFALFLVFYIWKIGPRVRESIAEEEAQKQQAEYADDATYEPLLERFQATHNDSALIDEYRSWAKGPHDNMVRIRFLQAAILDMIKAGKIYRVEDLMGDLGKASAEEGLTDRFEAFRSECDRLIAQVAQQRLAEN